MDLKDKIIEGDCVEILSSVPSNTFDMVITSPPYDNLRKYKGFSFNFENASPEFWGSFFWTSEIHFFPPNPMNIYFESFDGANYLLDSAEKRFRRSPPTPHLLIAFSFSHVHRRRFRSFRFPDV